MAISNLLASGFWNDFVTIFTGQFAWITIVLMVLGLILCIVEAVIPGFGIFGISGIVCEIASVVVFALVSHGTPLQILILILLITLFTLLIFLIFVRSARFGLLGKTPIVENKSSIPQDYGEKEEKELESLIGKEGIVVTECRPIGKVRINQKIYEVNTKGSLIQKGEVVKVVSIEDNTIYVSKITY